MRIARRTRARRRTASLPSPSPSARGGFLLGADGRATFSVAFHVVREACEAKAHHQRVAGTGRATARLSEDGGVSGLGGGVPAPSPRTARGSALCVKAAAPTGAA